MEEKPVISINPPPRDARCECCGRHISELKPFGAAGDPLVGDFNGALLVKNYRGMDYCPDKNDLSIVVREVSASWECRDCIILDEGEYWKKLNESRKQ